MDFQNNVHGEATLGFLLRSIYAQLQATVYARLRSSGIEGIRPAFSPIFRYLGDQGARLTSLAESAGMTKQSMAYLVEEMARLGWVHAEPDAVDRRARTISWTKEGRQIRDLVARCSREVEAEWAGLVGSEDWTACRETLERLAHRLRSPSDEQDAGTRSPRSHDRPLS